MFFNVSNGLSWAHHHSNGAAKFNALVGLFSVGFETLDKQCGRICKFAGSQTSQWVLLQNTCLGFRWSWCNLNCTDRTFVWQRMSLHQGKSKWFVEWILQQMSKVCMYGKDVALKE